RHREEAHHRRRAERVRADHLGPDRAERPRRVRARGPDGGRGRSLLAEAWWSRLAGPRAEEGGRRDRSPPERAGHGEPPPSPRVALALSRRGISGSRLVYSTASSRSLDETPRAGAGEQDAQDAR